MKKMIFIWCAMLMVFSGCGKSDLEAYQSAVLLTESYNSGYSETSLSVDVDFDESNLSFQEQRDLSYFEEIDLVTAMTYNAETDVFKGQMDGYFNFGGLGFDMVYYINGDDVLVKLPIMDKYMMVNSEAEVSDTSISMNQEDAIGRLVEAWNGVLKDEDVVSGSKAYVMTDKGQIKTTTYTIAINEAQFEVLKAVMLKILTEDGLVEVFLQNSQSYSNYDVDIEETQGMLQDLLAAVTLSSFEGKAYVDFDGRLVRQTFTADLVNHSAKAGQVASLHIEYETYYELLGQVETLTFPQVTDEDLLKMEDGDSIQDYFPEGLF